MGAEALESVLLELLPERVRLGLSDVALLLEEVYYLLGLLWLPASPDEVDGTGSESRVLAVLGVAGLGGGRRLGRRF